MTGEESMNDPAPALESVDITTILRYLPHRYPFLMIDRVIGMQGDERAIGIKHVSAHHKATVSTFFACFRY